MPNFLNFISEDIEAKTTLLSTMPVNTKLKKKKYNDKIEEMSESLQKIVTDYEKQFDPINLNVVPKEIKQKILEQYDVSEVVLDADLEDFIALCVRYRLVEV